MFPSILRFCWLPLLCYVCMAQGTTLEESIGAMKETVGNLQQMVADLTRHVMQMSFQDQESLYTEEIMRDVEFDPRKDEYDEPRLQGLPIRDLRYADDTALLSTTTEGLEKLIKASIKKLKLTYFGHIKHHETLEKHILEAKMKGKKGKGRPTRRWENDIEEWLETSTSQAGRLTSERETFRRRVQKATSRNG
ncbi:hypothetical protein PoB_001355900 [Plakobranchus ocellatus]|uniref:Reverse transcriptase domain-containing protein n=1 Tax=Plakobranchus ocellatus TaxID=259542 RepID=A0AAV3YZ67_9GAST|nr:hypothetical protein PoB_001355900 [Plakobranchus ocellatus]